MSVATEDAAEHTLRPEPWRRRIIASGATIIGLLLIVMLAIFRATQTDAFSPDVLTDLFNNALPLALAAAGGTLVVLTRGFDLSVAGVISLSNVLVATSISDGPRGALCGVAIVLALGLLVGAVNGLLVAYIGLQSITCTLATMIVCSGVALLILDAPGGNVPDALSSGMMGTVGLGLPVALVGILGLALVWLIIRKTNWGIGLLATGADRTAATLAGIPTRRVTFFAYIGAGLLYGLAGYFLTALNATGAPNSGEPYLLLTFAAIALGGTSFAGGRGGIIGSILAAIALVLLQKVLFAVGVSSFYTGIFQGAVMIAAVLVAAFTARLSMQGES
jgi:ribose transport system permease protein